jgi:hypothetical protein
VHQDPAGAAVAAAGSNPSDGLLAEA